MITTREYQAKFFAQRMEYWMSMLDAPYSHHRGENCDGRHGGSWDWWMWKIDERGSERSYCASCGGRVAGILSPWFERADRDWLATPYMQGRLAKWRNRSRKFAIKGTRQSWTTREI